MDQHGGQQSDNLHVIPTHFHRVALVFCRTAKIHDKPGKAVNRTMNDKTPVNQAVVAIKMPQAV